MFQGPAGAGTRSWHEPDRPAATPGTARNDSQNVDAPTTRGGYSPNQPATSDTESEEEATRRSAPPSSDTLSACPRRTRAGPMPRRRAGGGRQRDDPRPVRLCASRRPGPGAGDPRDREGEAKLLSGGYSLIPLIKLRLAQPALLVDMRDLTGLDGIVETDDHLVIGARATHRQIHDDPIVQDTTRCIVDVSGGIGDPQVRNWGTIGGSVAHADPASDWPAVLLAVSATLVCKSASGSARSVPASSSSTRSRPRSSHRGPDRDPLPAPPRSEAAGRTEVRAAGRRLRHVWRRCRRPSRRGRLDRGRGHRRDRRRRFAVRGDGRRGRPEGPAPVRGSVPRRLAQAAGAQARPAADVRGPGRLQARHGRRDDGPGSVRSPSSARSRTQ